MADMKLGNHIDAANNRVKNLGTPIDAGDAVNKSYVEGLINARSWKDPARAASAANLTLSGTQTVDGVALIAGDRVLVKDQTDASQNGLYVVAAGAWSRAADFDADSEVLGAAVFVSEGTTNGNQQWLHTTDDPVTVGTTSLTFAQIGGGSTYTAGNGINISGGAISVDASVVGRKASATIGDGSATSFNVSHNLNSSDVVVSVRAVSGGQQILTDWNVVDANTVNVSFSSAPTTGQYRVTVHG